ncbi:unnamed protein product [Phytomonas sp. Hart1]|nr:unnamed protein product [Phytomonas sp. Hart1]|eukprot:CCW71374.1 unnamed protein product [Phytomonas sp. isolate Hart1]
MGRVKVTPKGKVKKNIPITRVGKKQYLKRRFAHIRAVDVAGSNNRFTQKYFEGNNTATQSFTRLGLSIDPSSPKSVVEERKKKIKPNSQRKLEEENEMKAHEEQTRRDRIGRPVSEQEGSTIANLLHKYGTDLKRMALDPKLNPFQLNVRQLQRQIVNYLKWEKAAFPKAFAEAEARGWFSIEGFSDPKLRSGQQQRLLATQKHEEKNVNNDKEPNNNSSPSEKKDGSGTKNASIKNPTVCKDLKRAKGQKS